VFVELLERECARGGRDLDSVVKRKTVVRFRVSDPDVEMRVDASAPATETPPTEDRHPRRRSQVAAGWRWSAGSARLVPSGAAAFGQDQA